VHLQHQQDSGGEGGAAPSGRDADLDPVQGLEVDGGVGFGGTLRGGMRLTRGRIVRTLAAALLAGCFGVAGAPVHAIAQPQANADKASDKASIDARLKRVAEDLFSRTDRVNENIAELKAILALDANS